jgi:hypothetical protein
MKFHCYFYLKLKKFQTLNINAQQWIFFNIIQIKKFQYTIIL